MKRLFLLCFSLIACSRIMGQIEQSGFLPDYIVNCIQETGKDTVPELNECESDFFNFVFQNNRKGFDFYGKKIAIFKGSTGSIKTTKEWYFNSIKKSIEVRGGNNWYFYDHQMIVFDVEESKRTGYDAVVICQTKKLITKKELLKRLSK